ncbi:uncharacterized protein LOC142003668 [Carettochelys insculpta]|uniref:uncharacterized protein LOC142003668 n=1 Tax=Carettochelys insculpta TaxID=44489 RepID=UPI003EBDC030
MASGQWRALAEQFQLICPSGGAPGVGSPGEPPGLASCGHWVNAAGLQGWVQALLDQGITSFRCPRCLDSPWLWQELRKLGHFSDEIRARLEAQILVQEGARGRYRPCPHCQHLVQRLEPGPLRTPCLPCSQQAGTLYCFCWDCHMDWPDPPAQSESCSNPWCALQAALYDAPKIQAPDSSVKGCPSLRACPECQALVSHTGLGCPLVECPECWLEFCYRCLGDHLWEDDEVPWEQEEEEEVEEGLVYADSWEDSCTIAGRQELHRASQPRGEPRLSSASTPPNTPPASPRPEPGPSLAAPPGSGAPQGATPPPGLQDTGGSAEFPGQCSTCRSNASPRYGGAEASAPSPGFWGAEGTYPSLHYWTSGAMGPSPGYQGSREADASPRYRSTGGSFPSAADWGSGSTAALPGCWGRGLELGSPGGALRHPSSLFPPPLVCGYSEATVLPQAQTSWWAEAALAPLTPHLGLAPAGAMGAWSWW